MCWNGCVRYIARVVIFQIIWIIDRGLVIGRAHIDTRARGHRRFITEGRLDIVINWRMNTALHGLTEDFARRGRLNRARGLNSEVRASGTNYSAGERQLIAFCRAMYRDAPILILDEATASVDSETEARLQATLDKLMEGRTSLVEAHRLSTVIGSDSIIVLQQGRIVEQGNHEQLLALGGLYSKLYKLAFARDDHQIPSSLPQQP
jgi:ABC-type multidrug transport system ATPase subunit